MDEEFFTMACLYVIVCTHKGRKALVQVRTRKKSMGGVLQPPVHGKRKPDDRTPVGLILREVAGDADDPEGEGGGEFLRLLNQKQWRKLQKLDSSPNLVAFVVECTEEETKAYRYSRTEAEGTRWITVDDLPNFRAYSKAADVAGVSDDELVMFPDHLELMVRLLTE